MDVAEVCEDLLAERAGLLGAMGTLEVDLDAATPAEGWSVRDQLTHLAWFDEAATQSIVDPNAFRANRLPVPEAPVRLELGEVVLGPEDATDVVTGTLADFCLLVTQRRHLDDTDLEATGPVATTWLPIPQAFAGRPGAGRQPGQFS